MQLDFNQGDGEGAASYEDMTRLIKIGEVTSTNPSAHTCQVTFDDDGITSGDLQVVIPNSLQNHDHCMPDIGEDVICLFLPSGTEDGFVLGSVYAGDVKDPESSQDVRATTYKDGSRVAYDRSKHEAAVDIEGTHIKANQQTVDIEGAQTVNIKSATMVTIQTGQLILNIGGTKMRLDGSNCTIDTAQMTFTGNLQVNGDVSTSSNITAAGAVHGTNI